MPEVHGSTYDDADKFDDDDGKLLADQVVHQKPTNAVAVEGIDEEDEEDEDHLRQPMRRKQIVSSTEGATKRKKRPGKKNKESARGTWINV